MELSEETKRLKSGFYAAIEKDMQAAYHAGYTKGVIDAREGREERHVDVVAPAPCTVFKNSMTVKDFFQKINEEVDELKQEILALAELDDEVGDLNITINGMRSYDEPVRRGAKESIADEAADVCTVITSLLEAVGITLEMRNEAQRRVNQRNHERGRS